MNWTPMGIFRIPNDWISRKRDVIKSWEKRKEHNRIYMTKKLLKKTSWRPSNHQKTTGNSGDWVAIQPKFRGDHKDATGDVTYLIDQWESLLDADLLPEELWVPVQLKSITRSDWHWARSNLVEKIWFEASKSAMDHTDSPLIKDLLFSELMLIDMNHREPVQLYRYRFTNLITRTDRKDED